MWILLLSLPHDSSLSQEKSVHFFVILWFSSSKATSEPGLVPLLLVLLENACCLSHRIGWICFSRRTSEFQPQSRPGVTAVAVYSCAKARQFVLLGPASLIGLHFSTQKSCSTFLNVAPSGKEKSICSPKLRNCPQQLESVSTMKWFCLHLFLSMTKLLAMSAAGEEQYPGQESTDVCLGDWTGLKLHFYPGVVLWEARADLPSWGGAKPETQLAQETWACPWQDEWPLLVTASPDACVGPTDHSWFELHVVIPFLLKERANIKVSTSEGH